MKEDFLHVVWQFQLFSKKNITTEQGEVIHIIHPGYKNVDQGPDFSQAHLLINNMEWFGNIEIHIHASAWYTHRHHLDRNYDNVILHVVFENDETVYQQDGTILPTLKLKDRISESLFEKYKLFDHSGIHMPCSFYLKKIEPLYIRNMFDLSLVERLERKGASVLKMLVNANQDWLEVFWQLLVKSFGNKINDLAFEDLAKALPIKILLKHLNNPFQIEALLFGQAGFLDVPSPDGYHEQLKSEYLFLAKKYGILNHKLKSNHWKFLRTRPKNFPTVRLAQLTVVMQKSIAVFSNMDSIQELKEWQTLLAGTLPDYWKRHYHFNKKLNIVENSIPQSLVHFILLNAVIPFFMAKKMYGFPSKSTQELLDWLEKLPTEQNKITKEWINLGVPLENSFDSQGAIELFTQYCIKRKCLYCRIGTTILCKTDANATHFTSNTNFNFSN